MKLMNLVNKVFSQSTVESIDFALQSFVEKSKHINAAVLATTKGLTVGAYVPVTNSEKKYSQDTKSVKKLSVMSSSLYSQATSVSEEISDDKCNILTLETDSTKILFYAIPNTEPAVILTLIADKEKLLGELLFSAKSCSDIIEDLLVPKP